MHALPYKVDRSMMRWFGQYHPAVRRAHPAFAGLGIALVACLATPVLPACAVPVFQYALQHWEVSPYRLMVVHRGPLTASDRAAIERLRTATLSDRLLIDMVDAAAPPRRHDPEVETALAGKLDRPRLLLLYPENANTDRAIAWSGDLEDSALAALVDSPLRRALAERILAGVAVTWVLLDGGDHERDRVAAGVLERHLAELARTMVLPAADDDPDDQTPRPVIHPDFALLRLADGDPAEAMTRALLVNSEKGLADRHEPLAFACYGRGRFLTALYGPGLTDDDIAAVCGFLTSPCSCRIKEQNPGVDLLMPTDWRQRIAPAPAAVAAVITALQPEVVRIAPEPPRASASAPGDRRITVAALAITLAASAIAWAWVARRAR